MIIKEWKDMMLINHWDWFLYAYARSRNIKWHIDEKYTMIYVQHEKNEMGANNNLRAIIKRTAMLFSNYWFKQSVFIVHRLGLTNDQFCSSYIKLNKSSFFHLAKNAINCRRRFIDKFIFFNTCLIMIFLI